MNASALSVNDTTPVSGCTRKLFGAPPLPSTRMRSTVGLKSIAL